MDEYFTGIKAGVDIMSVSLEKVSKMARPNIMVPSALGMSGHKIKVR